MMGPYDEMVAVNVVAGMRSTCPQEPGSDGMAAEEAV